MPVPGQSSSQVADVVLATAAGLTVSAQPTSIVIPSGAVPPVQPPFNFANRAISPGKRVAFRYRLQNPSRSRSVAGHVGRVQELGQVLTCRQRPVNRWS